VLVCGHRARTAVAGQLRPPRPPPSSPLARRYFCPRPPHRVAVVALRIPLPHLLPQARGARRPLCQSGLWPHAGVHCPVRDNPGNSGILMSSRRFRRGPALVLRSPAPGQNSCGIRTFLSALAVAQRVVCSFLFNPRHGFVIGANLIEDCFLTQRDRGVGGPHAVFLFWRPCNNLTNNVPYNSRSLSSTF